MPLPPTLSNISFPFSALFELAKILTMSNVSGTMTSCYNPHPHHSNRKHNFRRTKTAPHLLEMLIQGEINNNSIKIRRWKEKIAHLSVGVSEMVCVDSSLPTEFSEWHWLFRLFLVASHSSLTASWTRFWSSLTRCRSCSSICTPTRDEQRNFIISPSSCLFYVITKPFSCALLTMESFQCVVENYYCEELVATSERIELYFFSDLIGLLSRPVTTV